MCPLTGCCPQPPGCEKNYEWSYYIAEFWNTASSLLIAYAGCVNARVHWNDRGLHGGELRHVVLSLMMMVRSWHWHLVTCLRARACVGVWVSVWVCGCVGVWVCGCVGVCVCVGVWVCVCVCVLVA